ncbi:hypothetical protein R2601_03608 [Salipiger bermudensis HTCC2601]|uniref:Uncharacterized protein n=1 Tax=Salipiger bermudensis (strain DSM 26914 / JCM 13377 / KCTC 12554 / HTCC2601) TaxID=314265 RepID=Q0FWC4_SALBH|nr:hypothetical protein R2601_03608 [Salipiger bermudensis HTCC2601]
MKSMGGILRERKRGGRHRRRSRSRS